MKKLYLIGIGMGSENLLTTKSKDLLALPMRRFITKGIEKRMTINGTIASLTEIMDLLKSNDCDTQLVVSGDVGFYSVSAMIYGQFSTLYDIVTVNGISSLQYFCGKLHMGYDKVQHFSMHGRENEDYIVPMVCYHRAVFVLCGGQNTVDSICRTLTAWGLGDVLVYVGENLSCPEERIRRGIPKKLQNEQFENLAVMLIVNEDYQKDLSPLYDADFIRARIPMTKFAVRQTAVAQLGIKSQDIIYDIGAGTGSVAIEMARRAKDGLVYAFEKKDEAVALINENIKKHKAYNVHAIRGEALEELLKNQYPLPQKVFIGGTSGNFHKITKQLFAMNPDVRIVVTAITLETVSEILLISEEIEIKDILCVNAAQAKEAGTYHLMIAQNPVYIISIKRKA